MRNCSRRFWYSRQVGIVVTFLFFPLMITICRIGLVIASLELKNSSEIVFMSEKIDSTSNGAAENKSRSGERKCDRGGEKDKDNNSLRNCKIRKFLLPQIHWQFSCEFLIYDGSCEDVESFRSFFVALIGENEMFSSRAAKDECEMTFCGFVNRVVNQNPSTFFSRSINFFFSLRLHFEKKDAMPRCFKSHMKITTIGQWYALTQNRLRPRQIYH